MKNSFSSSALPLLVGVFLATNLLPSEAATWQQTHRIQQSINGLGEFVTSVSLVDDVAVIGFPSSEDPFLKWSHAYTYNLNTGEQLGELEPDWPVGGGFGGRFGFSTGTDGDSIIVGAGPEEFTSAVKGGAFVFDSSTGEQIAQLFPEGVGIRDDYGYSVAISGNSAIVGASSGGSFNLPGSAYLFNIETEQLIAELKAPPASFPSHDYFGDSVAISDQFAIVGAPNFSFDGGAFLYDVQTGESLGQLVPESRAKSFGTSIAISNGIAIIGADHRQGGAAYLFDLESGEQLHELVSNDIASGDQFGNSVAISGNWALVGAPGNDDQGSYSGSAYLFDITTGEQLSKFVADDLHAGSGFGRSVALDGSTILIAAGASTSGYGAAYVFELVPEPSSLLCLLIGVVTFLPFNDRRYGC